MNNTCDNERVSNEKTCAWELEWEKLVYIYVVDVINTCVITLMFLKVENHVLYVKYEIFGQSMRNLHGFLMRLCKFPHK